MQVADLKPGGALYRAVTTGPSELQEHFPIELRRQYLHELFPDLSVDANYEEEPDHHQLIVPRDELTQESLAKDSCPVSLTANVTRFPLILCPHGNEKPTAGNCKLQQSCYIELQQPLSWSCCTLAKCLVVALDVSISGWRNDSDFAQQFADYACTSALHVGQFASVDIHIYIYSHSQNGVTTSQGLEHHVCRRDGSRKWCNEGELFTHHSMSHTGCI